MFLTLGLYERNDSYRTIQIFPKGSLSGFLEDVDDKGTVVRKKDTETFTDVFVCPENLPTASDRNLPLCTLIIPLL